MRIEKLYFEDNIKSWTLTETTFDTLTLLVGASGVGKTQILQAIRSLSAIASGGNKNGLAWKVFFTIEDRSYIWEGSFEVDENYFEDSPFMQEDEKESSKKPKIIYENVFIDNTQVIQRQNHEILFNGVKTVKLAPETSIISHLKEEDVISIIHQAFSRINYLSIDFNRPFIGFNPMESKISIESYNSSDDIKNSDLSLRTKLFISFQKKMSVYEDIVFNFRSIFPYVEDIKIDTPEEPFSFIFNNAQRYIFLKETGVPKWIGEKSISSGMLKTLLQLAEIFLCPNGSVMLIDEFENSLGINCIDDVTKAIINNMDDMQFIITSHHPYIINNIPIANWKIVARKGGKVKTYSAQELNISNSKHEAFTRLINIDAYRNGTSE